MKFLLIVLALIWLHINNIYSVIETANAQEVRIVQNDSLGNPQYHKQQYKIVNDKIYHADSTGNIQYHKQQYKIVNDRIYHIDTFGNIESHKGYMQLPPNKIAGK